MKRVLSLLLLAAAVTYIAAVSSVYAGGLSILEKTTVAGRQVALEDTLNVQYGEGNDQYPYYGFQRQIHSQEKRMNNGLRSGQIDRQDYATLRDNLKWIRSRITRLGETGRLSPEERGRIQGMLDQNNSMLYAERHAEVRRLY